MLQNKISGDFDLQAEKIKASELLPAELQQYIHPDDKILEISYPVSVFPEKVTSISFDKEPVISGILDGIKGQYLIFSDGRVLNIRKHNGYWLELSLND